MNKNKMDELELIKNIFNKIDKVKNKECDLKLMRIYLRYTRNMYRINNKKQKTDMYEHIIRLFNLLEKEIEKSEKEGA